MIDALLTLNPDLFRAPASADELASAETAFGTLPADLVQLWQRGSGSDVIDELRFLSVSEAITAYEDQLMMAQEAEDDTVFTRDWIPFSSDGEEPGDYTHLYCLDRSAGEPTVLVVHHIEGSHGLVSPSLPAFIQSVANLAKQNL